MAGIQDFIVTASQKLGIPKEAAASGAGALLKLIQQQAGAADFAAVTTAVPGAADVAKAGDGGGGGGGLGGALGGLASKASGMLGGAGGGAAGLVAKLAGAGITGDKATGFVKMFVDFLKSKVSPDVLKGIASKVPGLGGLLG
jgi:hypothetical protein